jgi:hypothetical protein
VGRGRGQVKVEVERLGFYPPSGDSKLSLPAGRHPEGLNLNLRLNLTRAFP